MRRGTSRKISPIPFPRILNAEIIIFVHDIPRFASICITPFHIAICAFIIKPIVCIPFAIRFSIPRKKLPHLNVSCEFLLSNHDKLLKIVVKSSPIGARANPIAFIISIRDTIVAIPYCCIRSATTPIHDAVSLAT